MDSAGQLKRPLVAPEKITAPSGVVRRLSGMSGGHSLIAEVEGYVPVRGRIAIIILLLGLAGPIGAKPNLNPDTDNQHREYVTALSALRPLAEEGDSFAQLALGVMYFNGWNTPQDYVQARKWFNLASSRSPPGTDHDAAVAGRDLVGAKMTPAQIDEAQALTQEWFLDLERRESAGH